MREARDEHAWGRKRCKRRVRDANGRAARGPARRVGLGERDELQGLAVGQLGSGGQRRGEQTAQRL